MGIMLCIFTTAGHPTIEKSVKALQILDDAGIDLIEIGVPFSDPLADGPVIQKSSFTALKNGVNLDKVFEIIQEARKGRKPQKSNNAFGKKGLDNVILFSYYNPLYSYGFDKLIEKCLENNVRGALIPDLPMDEAKELNEKFKAKGLDLVQLAAPTSTKEREKAICEMSSPFVYLVSRVGVTGGSQNLDNGGLKEHIKNLKANTKNPIGLGFGIDSPEKVKEALALGADMAIIGSKTVKLLEEDQTKDLKEFQKFILSLK